MKHYFFVNPVAGKGKGIVNLVGEIEAATKALNADCEIYITKAVGDGEKKARELAGALGGKEGRFYACGGDGTNNEIINGIMGFDNVAAGCIPIGTGNDMIRNFPGSGDFLSIEDQLRGEVQKVDLVKYSGVIGGGYVERYCANMFNIGFDCNVVELAARLKQKPLIAGSTAYLLAVLGMFIKKKGISLTLIEDDKVIADGEVLLCAIANGSYCGGGMYTSPQASLQDGEFDLNIIKDVPRLTFLKLFPKYQKGTHLSDPRVEKILTLRKCKALTLLPKEKEFFLCADGEISLAKKVDFEIAPGALSFVVPKAARD